MSYFGFVVGWILLAGGVITVVGSVADPQEFDLKSGAASFLIAVVVLMISHVGHLLADILSELKKSTRETPQPSPAEPSIQKV